LKPSDGVAFLIAGKSRIPNQEEINYQRDLINIAEREGIAGRVYFGSFELSDMFAIYKMCAIAVLPSVREAFGLVLLESMALMIPVIAANSPGMVDVVSDGVNALTFPPRDHRKLAEQMRKILENTELAKRLRDTGLKTVLRRFDHARMADDHYGLYRTLLQR
jgi:glycosyltransferase involved in cell wall biosynthesis